MKHLKQSLLLGFLGLSSAFAAEKFSQSPISHTQQILVQANEHDANDFSPRPTINLLEVEEILKTANMLQTEECLEKIRIGLVDEEEGNVNDTHKYGEFPNVTVFRIATDKSYPLDLRNQLLEEYFSHIKGLGENGLSSQLQFKDKFFKEDFIQEWGIKRYLSLFDKCQSDYLKAYSLATTYYYMPSSSAIQEAARKEIVKELFSLSLEDSAVHLCKILADLQEYCKKLSSNDKIEYDAEIDYQNKYCFI